MALGLVKKKKKKTQQQRLVAEIMSWLLIIQRACYEQFHVGTLVFLCQHAEGGLHLRVNKKLAIKAN